MPSDEEDLESFRVGADFPAEGSRVTRYGRAGTARADGSVEWDDRDDA